MALKPASIYSCNHSSEPSHNVSVDQVTALVSTAPYFPPFAITDAILLGKPLTELSPGILPKKYSVPTSLNPLKIPYVHDFSKVYPFLKASCLEFPAAEAPNNVAPIFEPAPAAPKIPPDAKPIIVGIN